VFVTEAQPEIHNVAVKAASAVTILGARSRPEESVPDRGMAAILGQERRVSQGTC